MKQINSLSDLLAADLNTIYNAEKQQAQSLQNLAKKAQSTELKHILSAHAAAKKENVKKIEHTLFLAGVKPENRNNTVVDEIFSHGLRTTNQADDKVADAGIAGFVQQAAHYNMANYGTAAAHAQTLGLKHVAEILHDTLKHERGIDEKLTDLAEKKLNLAARHG